MTTIILKAHQDEVEHNIKNLEKCLHRMITVGDALSHRLVDLETMKLIHTLECFKEVVSNIKSKNLKEWKAKQQL